jgi:NAD(P)-dependent dehydrogenase (short-subunit alcohol dehydrogenase family)
MFGDLKSTTTPCSINSVSMLDLTGKVAVVLGVGQTSATGWGIGCAIATLLARQGALVVGGNRTIASAQVTKQRIESEGGKCEVYTADATSASSIDSLISAVLERYGKIDILVNNVGRSAPGDLATMTEATWDSQITLNLKSAYLACHHVLPIMERQGHGAVVSISSIAGLRHIGKPQIGYNVAKAGMNQMMKATAVEYAARGVRLNTVSPGLMYTPYSEALAARYGAKDAEAKQKYMRMRDQQVPMGRMGDAWDVARSVLFLVSDEASYITGQEIVVDGGITASTGRMV